MSPIWWQKPSSAQQPTRPATRVFASWGYIFGENRGARKIAMTAPVAQAPAKIAMTAPVAQSASPGGYVVQFSMPREWTLETLPEPLDPRVTLRAVPRGLAGTRVTPRRAPGSLQSADPFPATCPAASAVSSRGTSDRPGSRRYRIRRDRDPVHPNDDPRHVAAEKLPEGRGAARIDDRDVQKRMEPVAQHAQCQGQRTRLRLQQMAIGRMLRAVLGRREPGALGKIHHARRHDREFPAGDPRGLEVFAPLLGMRAQIGVGMAPHERKIQRPPREPDDRHVDQLLLEEELEHRDVRLSRCWSTMMSTQD